MVKESLTSEMKDPEIRATLRPWIINRDKVPCLRICDELKVSRGSCRIDLAAISTSIHGYEIKSDCDTLRRLPRQSEHYGRVFRRVTAVAGERHLARVREQVPAWWGILCVHSSGDVQHVDVDRNGKENEDALDIRALVEMLEKNELSALLYRNGLKKGTSRFGYAELADLASRNLPVDHIEREVSFLLSLRYEFKERWATIDRLAKRELPTAPKIAVIDARTLTHEERT